MASARVQDLPLRPGRTVPAPGRGPTVLAFARSTSGFYFGELLAGLTREVARVGGRVVIVQTLDPNGVADVVMQSPTFDLPVAWDQVDGAVAMSLAADAPLLDRLREAGKPIILTHRVEGFDAPLVLANNRAAVHVVVEHLLAHGPRRIGFVGSPVQDDMRERYDAYLEAVESGMVEHGQMFETVDYGQTGRVLLTTLTKEFFMARFPERDEGEREMPFDTFPWDGVSGVRPFHEIATTTTVGVY